MQKEVEVHIYQHGTQELVDVDYLDYEHYTFHEAYEIPPPSAALLVMMENVSKPNRPQRLPATGPLNVCTYKVTDRAGDVWSNFEGTTAALWQVCRLLSRLSICGNNFNY